MFMLVLALLAMGSLVRALMLVRAMGAMGSLASAATAFAHDAPIRC